MEAKLNIYNDCTSEKPTKSYICRRLTYGACQKIDNYSNQVNDLESKKNKELKKEKPDTELINNIAEEQFQLNLDILKAIFPDFQDDDFNGIDVYEYQGFMIEIGKEKQRIFDRASKN